MSQEHLASVADQLNLNTGQVGAVAGLLDEGATIPFIARYRKEATGSLDEVTLTTIRDSLRSLAELDARKRAILKSLDQNGHLTAELEQQVRKAESMVQVEDIYLPFRPKRRTRASQARQKGLAPLADILLQQADIDPGQAAAAFLDPERGVASLEDALAGARDIIAEMVNENPRAREQLRALYSSRGEFVSTVAKEQAEAGVKYRDYYDYREPVAQAPSHRILAMRRGEKKGF